jgi:lipopolysaccharide heptosyltransferase II
MPPGPHILVVRFSSLGDVVLTTPLLRALHARHPAATVTFVVSARFADVLAGHPGVTRLVPVAPGESVRALARRLAPDAFDVRIDLQDSPRSRRLRRRLGGRWRTVDRRRAARLLLIWLGLDRYGTHVPMAERYFAAARGLDVAPDGGPAEVFPRPADEARAAPLAPPGFVALAPGASRASKCWPPAHWRALAERLLAAGRSIVAVGGPADRPLLDLPGVVPAYGLPLLVTAALLRRARVVVANDSGMLHLATAVGRPVVALVGPTVRAFGFFPYAARAEVLERPLACRPCSPFGSDHCPLGHHRCMIEIAPAAVHAAVERAA